MRHWASSSMHQTGAIEGLGHCVDWACHVINSRLDLLHLIKTIPSGEQTSMSQCETRPRREGDHTATLSLCGRGGERGGGVGGGGDMRAQHSGFVVSLIADPLMSLWFPCQSVLIELTVVLLLHILISCSRTVTRPSSVCLASADQTQLLCWILTTPLLLLGNMLPLRYAET